MIPRVTSLGEWLQEMRILMPPHSRTQAMDERLASPAFRRQLDRRSVADGEGEGRPVQAPSAAQEHVPFRLLPESSRVLPPQNWVGQCRAETRMWTALRGIGAVIVPPTGSEASPLRVARCPVSARTNHLSSSPADDDPRSVS